MIKRNQKLLALYEKLCLRAKHTPHSLKKLQEVESQLLKNQLIEPNIADERTNRICGYKIMFDDQRHLIDIETGENLDHVGKNYSYMKFGSVKDIQFFADLVTNTFIKSLNQPGSPLKQMLETAKKNKQFVAHIESGSRNVEHSGFLVFDEAMRRINTHLALNGLPTLVKVRPYRLEVVPGTYATMSKEERETLAPTTDHIMPGKELFNHGVHVVFSDDVRITGATADKVERQFRTVGALSYRDVYLLSVLPSQALNKPELEARLNHLAVTGQLDESMKYILEQPGLRPVQRLLRLILNSKKNREGLPDFFDQYVPIENVLRIYLAALNNNYLSDPSCRQSVETVREYLKKKGVLDQAGLPIKGSFEY